MWRARHSGGAQEDEMLFNTLRQRINREKVELVEMETDINDQTFAVAAADKLMELMKRK